MVVSFNTESSDDSSLNLLCVNPVSTGIPLSTILNALSNLYVQSEDH